MPLEFSFSPTFLTPKFNIDKKFDRRKKQIDNAYNLHIAILNLLFLQDQDFRSDLLTNIPRPNIKFLSVLIQTE
jgi:hypothetical protein